MTVFVGSMLLTPEDVARRLQLNVETIRDYLRAGKIKGIHVARKWRVTEEALAHFVQELMAEEGHNLTPTQAGRSLASQS